MVLTPDGVEDRITFDLGGSGPPLLMVHATGFHGHIWAPVADHLQSDFHCWALDLRGHGDSGAPADLDFSWGGFAQDIQSVVGALGLEHARAVGHSLAAATLLMVEQLVPGTFGSIFAYEPAICVPAAESGDDGSAEAIDLALRRRTSFPSRRDALDNFAGKPPMDSFAHEALAAYVEHGFAEDGDGRCPSQVPSRVRGRGLRRVLRDLDLCTAPRGALPGRDRLWLGFRLERSRAQRPLCLEAPPWPARGAHRSQPLRTTTEPDDAGRLDSGHPRGRSARRGTVRGP